jgi:integrase
MLGADYKEELEGGKVLLFVRNGFLHARVYRGERRYIYKSLKTTDLNDGRRAATRLFYEIDIKRSEGLPIQQVTFSRVIDEYVRLREKHYEQSLSVQSNASFQDGISIHMLRQIQRVVKFWHEFCGTVAVDKVDNAKLTEYVLWRKDYYRRMPEDKRPKNHRINPADKTLEWELSLGKTILKFATERGYRGRAPLPTYTFRSATRIVRPAFPFDDYTRLYRRLQSWIRETDVPQWRYTRELLRDYVLILANSGMRVGEANNLTEGDLRQFYDLHGHRNYMLDVKGKTGKRVVVPRTCCVRPIERTLRRNAEWKARWAVMAEERRARGEIVEEQQDWFFRMADGSKVTTLIDQLQTVLRSIDMETNRYGERYTLYSLRHFYATHLLRKGRVQIFDLARNMGTSVQIIEHYYGKHAQPADLVARLGR